MPRPFIIVNRHIIHHILFTIFIYFVLYGFQLFVLPMLDISYSNELCSFHLYQSYDIWPQNFYETLFDPTFGHTLSFKVSTILVFDHNLARGHLKILKIQLKKIISQ
jgi:hypothetical protein